MTTRPAELTALTRFGLGPKPGELAAIKDDPRGYLSEQCGDPIAAMVTGPGLLPLDTIRHGYAGHQRTLREARLEVKRSNSAPAAVEAQSAARMVRRDFVQGIDEAEIAARFQKGMTTAHPFVERLVLFWSNHFAIDNSRGVSVRVSAGNFEREAIRPHVLGFFEDMVVSATMHPAMLSYLDNTRNFGPNSPRGLRNGVVRANENLAREVLELHTMGAGGGYTQADVGELAKTLSGWHGGFQASGNGVIFDHRFHEPGPRTILGKTYKSEGPMQLEEVLPDIANHPSTARHIARKLAQYFVADAAPASLIDALEDTFRVTGGDLREVALTLVAHDAAWSGEPRKTVPPYDFTMAAGRAVGAEIPAGFLRRSLRFMAQEVWARPSPAGWPADDGAFLGGDSLLERVDFAKVVAQRFGQGTRARDLAADLFGDTLDPFVKEAVDRAESQRQALTLLLMSPVFHRR